MPAVPAAAPWPPRRLVLAWTGGYLAATLLFCGPFLPLTSFASAPDWGDARLIAWTLAWHARWPVSGEWPLDAPFFAPDAGALANSEPMVALGLAAAPLTTLAGPVVAFNVLRLVLPVANALALACLVWHYLRDGWAALVAGAALGFAYSQIATVYLGLVHLAVLAGFALAPLWLDRWWRGGRTRDLAVAVAIAAAQALVSWYAAVLVVLVLTVQTVWLFASEGPGWRHAVSRAVTLGAAAAIAGVVLWPAARPFIGLPPPAVEELRGFSLQPSFYVRPPLDTWVGAWLQRGAAGAAWDYTRSYFVGVTTALAAVVGVIAGRRIAAARRLRWAIPLGLLGFALSLGPSGPDTGWRPFDLLTAVPGVMAFRAPGRMAVLVAFSLAVLAGVAVHAVPTRRRGLVAAALVAGLIAEGVMIHRPRSAPAVLTTPAIFARLAGDAPQAALVVPMLADTPSWPAEADYLLFARHYWTPLVNGYGRRAPANYLALLDTVTAFPGAPLGDALRFYGVSHVVVLPSYHPARAAAFVAAADASADFERVAVDGDTVLYRVRAVPGRAGAPSRPGLAAPRS